MAAFYRIRISPRPILLVAPLIGATAVVIGPSLLAPSLNGVTPRLNTASVERRRFPLEVSSAPIDFGALAPGEPARVLLTVRNVQGDPVTLGRIETSCLCVALKPTQARFGPREIRTFTASFDPQSDLDFRGQLAVDVTGYLTGGEVAFRTEARIELGDGFIDQD